MKVSIIGIDLAKDVFQVGALNQAGKEIMNKKVRRNKLRDVVRQFEPCVLAMEACGSAHYWGRVFRNMGHEVRLIPPQHVKAFCRINRTDLIKARGRKSCPTQTPDICPLTNASVDSISLTAGRRPYMSRISPRISNR